MAPPRARSWVGVDIGKTHHWVSVVDANGVALLSVKVMNDEAEILALISAVCELAEQAIWAVGIIGAPSALLLALLAQAGQSVRYASGRVVAAMSSAYTGEGKTDAKDAYVIAETAARDYPAFLRGKRSGEDILLAPTRLPLWVAYFSNGNLLYAVNNRVGAVAVEAWMPPAVGAILEVGGGCASGTSALLERLATVGRLGDVSRYRFTELVPAFLRRGQRNVEERFSATSGLSFEPLDMNRPFGEQEIAPASVSIVYAVNTLHVAHDLAFTLAEMRRALEPDGQLIISECVRPFPGQTLYPEFVFNLMATFRAPKLHPDYRPNGGFLTTGQWASALEAAGFVDVRVLPDVAGIRDVFPTFYAAAIGATRAA